MIEFLDYDILLPELVYDVVDYFRISNNIKPVKDKTVLDYCLKFADKYSLPEGDQIQPSVVYKICDNLAKKGILNRIGLGLSGLPEFSANFMFISKDDEFFLSKHPSLVFTLNCMAYGFRYIYNEYRQYVLPIVVKKDEDISMGTCFKYHNGILTAKHCVEADEVSIQGYTSEDLNKCKVLISTDDQIDLAYIDLNEPSKLTAGKANVLDEVLVMGYPKLPRFFDFCTAERAAISSIPTKGTIASLADQFISKNVGKLMLVTARIRGGNSGGPIISAEGLVLGVAFCGPMSEGDYDDMGYGIAYPIHVFDSLLQDNTTLKVNFVDKIES